MPSARTGALPSPPNCANDLGSNRASSVNCIEENGRLILIPITVRGIKEIMGSLKPKPGEPSVFEELFKERARERQREDIKAAQYEAEFKGKSAKDERIKRSYRNTFRALGKVSADRAEPTTTGQRRFSRSHGVLPAQRQEILRPLDGLRHFAEEFLQVFVAVDEIDVGGVDDEQV